MPLFALHALDRPGTIELRLEHYAAHRSFVENESARPNFTIVMSGPLQSEDGETMVGSLFIVEADDLATVEAFAAADPFTTAGVWGEVRINRFVRRT
jgi:uncharacterized protein YciI